MRKIGTCVLPILLAVLVSLTGSLCSTTGAPIGKWHLRFQESGYDKVLPGGPADRGFDSFFGFRVSTDIPPYFYLRGNRVVMPPTSEIAEHHSEGLAKIQGEFRLGGGIAPGLDSRDVLPRLTEEAICDAATPTV